MALSVGDAVLTFLGDTTQLDQAFNKIATEAGEKLGIATTGAVNSATGAIEGMSKSMAVGQQGAVELGNITDLAGEKVRESMYEARGEIGLLGEAFGINLPRHVRSFVAELPGVGTALSAAFQATAVLFLLDALVKGIEKIIEFAEHGEKVAQAWAKASLELENVTIKEGDHTKSLELANLKLDDQIAKLEHRPEANKLREALLETGIAADQLASAFSKDFEKMTAEIIAATGFTSQFSQGLSSVFRSGLGSDLTGSLAAGLSAGVTGIIAVKNALTQVDEKLLEINKLRVEQANAKTEEQQIAAAHALAEAYGVLAQTSKNALGIVQLNAPDNIKLITQLSSTVITATAAQKDFGLQSENVLKKVQVASLELINEELKAWEKRHKAVEHYMKVLADYEKAQEKQHEKTIKDSEKEKEELNAANNSVALNQVAQLHKMGEAGLVFIDGEIKATELSTQLKANLLDRQYRQGIISGKQYLEEIKGLYKKETDDLTSFLNQKQQIVTLEAKKEAAARGQIISDADAKELKAYVDLENKKAQVLIQADIKIEKQEDKVLKDAQKRFAAFGTLFKAYEAELQKSGKASAAWGAAVGAAISEVMQAWAQGSITFDQALKNMLASLIQATAKEAEIQGVKQLALAFGSWPDFAGMEQHFAAAALWFALGGGLSLGGAMLSGGGSSGGGNAGQGPQVDQNNPNNQTGKNPAPGGRNVPHLAGGGLISEPTLAMIGEGGSREAVIPLDSGVMDAIGEAIARHHAETGGGTTHIWQIKGMVSSDTAGKLMKKMSRQVQTGRSRLLSNDALKTTRRG